MWENKQRASAFSPSVSPFFKSGALCSQAQSEGELTFVKGFGTLTLEMLQSSTSFFAGTGAEAEAWLSKYAK